MPFGLGIWEIVILAIVLVLLFGSKGAPAMARRLGTGLREMKDAVADMDPRSAFDKDEPAAPKARPAIEAAPAVVVPAAEAQVAATPVAAEAPAPSDDAPAAS